MGEKRKQTQKLLNSGNILINFYEDFNTKKMIDFMEIIVS